MQRHVGRVGESGGVDRFRGECVLGPGHRTSALGLGQIGEGDPSGQRPAPAIHRSVQGPKPILGQGRVLRHGTAVRQEPGNGDLSARFHRDGGETETGRRVGLAARGQQEGVIPGLRRGVGADVKQRVPGGHLGHPGRRNGRAVGISPPVVQGALKRIHRTGEEHRNRGMQHLFQAVVEEIASQAYEIVAPAQDRPRAFKQVRGLGVEAVVVASHRESHLHDALRGEVQGEVARRGVGKTVGVSEQARVIPLESGEGVGNEVGAQFKAGSDIEAVALHAIAGVCGPTREDLSLARFHMGEKRASDLELTAIVIRPDGSRSIRRHHDRRITRPGERPGTNPSQQPSEG